MHSRKVRNLIVRTLGTESKAILTRFANRTGYGEKVVYNDTSFVNKGG